MAEIFWKASRKAGPCGQSLSTIVESMYFDDASGPDRYLVGLENRLKGRDRIEERISHDMRKRRVSADRAIAAQTDLIRYTFQYPDDTYADGVRTDIKRM